MSSWENISLSRNTSHKDVICKICKCQYNLFSIFGNETCGNIDEETNVVKAYYQYIEFFNTVCYWKFHRPLWTGPRTTSDPLTSGCSPLVYTILSPFLCTRFINIAQISQRIWKRTFSAFWQRERERSKPSTNRILWRVKESFYMNCAPVSVISPIFRYFYLFSLQDINRRHYI